MYVEKMLIQESTPSFKQRCKSFLLRTKKKNLQLTLRKNHRNRCGPKGIPRSTPRLNWCPYTWLLWCSWLFAEPNQLVFLAASPWFIHTAASSKDSAVVDIALLIVIIIWLLRWVSICSRTTVGSAGETFQIAT